MPKLDGAEGVRIIRAESETPIIVVSGENDRVVPAQLLDLGADDYVRKGVPSAELLARGRGGAVRGAARAGEGGGAAKGGVWWRRSRWRRHGSRRRSANWSRAGFGRMA